MDDVDHHLGSRVEQLTGNEAVDAAVRRLDALEGLPLDQHHELFDEIHRGLAAVLDNAAEVPRAGT